ncbi:MAG: lysostaphin resistance A-like protein [Cellulosilyticaceae bacterium]
MKQYIKVCSGVILYGCFMIGLLMGSQYIVGLGANVFMGAKYVNQHMYFLTLVAYSISLLGILCVNAVEGDTFGACYRGFTMQMFMRTLKFALPLWLLVCVVNGLLRPFFPNYDVQVETLFVSSEPVLRFVVLVIGAPFLEEYLFREKIQLFVKERFGSKVAILFQGILFGMIHPFGLQKVYATVMGLGLGWMREKIGHILAPTVIHMIINGIGFVVGSMT